MAILPILVALIAFGCGDSGSNPTAPPADSRGTPLGAAATFYPTSRFVWSAATNEIVGAGGFASSAPGGLVALHSFLGTSRVLDPFISDSPLAPASGTPIYYEGIVPGDTTPAGAELRRISLSGGGPVTIEAAPATSVFVQTVSADGGWLAWTEGAQLSPSPDSIVIQNAVSGSRTLIAPGVPELISPDGAQLLYSTSPRSFPPPLVLHDRKTGTDMPFELGLPAGAAPAGMRWDAAGVHALFVLAQQQIWVRHVATGVEEMLYESGDTLLAYTGTWSPDGSGVAMWGESQSGTAQSLRLSVHVVDVAAKSGSVVAFGEIESPFGMPFLLRPSGIVFSPDSRMVAYEYGDQLFTTAVPIGPMKMSGSFGRATPATSAR